MKISISKVQILAVLAVLVVAGSIYIIYYRISPKPNNVYNFFGIDIPFRTNLKDANNITIYPDNETIYDMFWNPELENITIAWVNSSDNVTNGMIAVEAFEIVYKLQLAYQHIGYLNNVVINVGFGHKVVDSYENLSATKENPIIALIPPKFANETAVKARNNVIYISGKTFDDFDLATVKFLMVALAINI